MRTLLNNNLEAIKRICAIQYLIKFKLLINKSRIIGVIKRGLIKPLMDF